MPQRGLGLAIGVVAVAAAALVFALVLGPGDERRPLTADQYRERLVVALTHVHLDADPADPHALREASDEFHELVAELTDFVPPPEAAAMHARFVNGLDDYARWLERLADSGRAGVVELQQQLAEMGGVPAQEWVQAFNDLVAHGYVTYRSE
jgi:hypothetical protein